MSTRAFRLLVFGAAIAWAVGLRIAVHRHGHYEARRSAAEAGESAKLGRTLAARVPPLEAPANTVSRADARRLRPTQLVALARANRTVELRDVLEGVAEATGVEEEQRVRASFHALGFADAPMFDTWIIGFPDSPVAYVARAAARLVVVRRAAPASCDASGRRIPSAQSRATIVSARNDLERALELRSTLVVAHTLLAESYVLEGTPVPRAALDRALDVCSACLGPREEYLLSLRPDTTAMQDFAEE